MTEQSKPPLARPVAPPTRPTVRIPVPPTPKPDDVTPLHVLIPDYTWFPCPHCARLIQCPPEARPVARALDRVAPIQNPPATIVAPELEPGPSERQDLTRIMPQQPPGTPP
jgi:hypothetical protein